MAATSFSIIINSLHFALETAETKTMLDDSLIPRFRESLFGAKYNLLLGAGASLDSTDRYGKSLPSSDSFRKGLCKLKNVRETTSLPHVYGILEPDEIRKHVVDRLMGCRPGLTAKSLPQFLWKFIFTFNVDDALEAAYESNTDLAKQDLSILNFNAPYSTGS